MSTIDYNDFLDLWVEEKCKNNYSQRFRVVETLYNGKSSYQKIDVVRSQYHGAMLFLDGLVMVSELDEFIYHDMISHVPLFVHPDPKRVLIIGGGDGGTAREVLRHEKVEYCRMIEIDEKVVDVSRKYFPKLSSALDHPKLDLVFEDGVRFVKETEERFDVVLIDSTDPIGPGKALFGEAFYKDIFRVLSEDGVMVAQGESSYHNLDIQIDMLKNVNKSFPKVHLYNYSNMTYPNGIWSFVFASKGLCPLKDLDRVRAGQMKCAFYNTATHEGAFALSQYQVDVLGLHLSQL